MFRSGPNLDPGPRRRRSLPVHEPVPRRDAFDGDHLWVSDRTRDTVVKVRASDGAVLGTFPTGGEEPIGVAFDGANIWVPNSGAGTVTKH